MRIVCDVCYKVIETDDPDYADRMRRIHAHRRRDAGEDVTIVPLPPGAHELTDGTWLVVLSEGDDA